MIPYRRDIEPPAPFLDVIIEHPVTSQRLSLSARIDTGADISAIPNIIVEQLRLIPSRSILVEGYNSAPVSVFTFVLTLEIANARFRIEAVTTNDPYVIVGRDLLNYFYTRLNGPDLTFDLSLSPAD